MNLSVALLREGARLPTLASVDAAGFDVHACLSEPVCIAPGAFSLIPTGLAMAIPQGWEGQVRPRSGLARKHGVTVLNAPGTVDADYRGEVGVLLVNHGREPFSVADGDRIAQIVFAPLAPRPVFVQVASVEALGLTARGEGGFGSTGVASRTV